MKIKLTVLSICSLLAAGSLSAHHSFAPYDIRNPVDIAGVAVDFVYRRPHPMLTFLDENNVEWEIEVPVRFWERAGLPQDAIAAGDEIIVRGFPARTGVAKMALAAFEKEGTFYSVHEQVGQRSANEAADAIESGESLESVLERFADEE